MGGVSLLILKRLSGAVSHGCVSLFNVVESMDSRELGSYKDDALGPVSAKASFRTLTSRK